MDTGAGLARQQAGEVIRRSRGREFRSIGIQLGHRYVDSPICVPDGTPEPPDRVDHYEPSTWPGARAPHAWLPDGSSTLDHYGRGFVLVVHGDRDVGPARAAAAARGVPLTVLRLEDPAVVALHEQPLTLVRPDGHVAWRGPGIDDPGALVDRVRGAGLTRRAGSGAASGVR